MITPNQIRVLKRTGAFYHCEGGNPATQDQCAAGRPGTWRMALPGKLRLVRQRAKSLHRTRDTDLRVSPALRSWARRKVPLR
jgi:hypothetical protein